MKTERWQAWLSDLVMMQTDLNEIDRRRKEKLQLDAWGESEWVHDGIWGVYPLIYPHHINYPYVERVVVPIPIHLLQTIISCIRIVRILSVTYIYCHHNIDSENNVNINMNMNMNMNVPYRQENGMKFVIQYTNNRRHTGTYKHIQAHTHTHTHTKTHFLRNNNHII